MRIVIFGTGMYCDRRLDNINKNVEIVAFVDNNDVLWGEKKNGIPISSPGSIKDMQYDVVVLMSLSSDEMKKQLLNIGVERKKIKYYEEFRAEQGSEKIEVYFDYFKKCDGKKVLLAIHELGYHGASNIALYTARALCQRGYQVTIIAADGDEKYIKTVIKEGFLVLVYGGLYGAKIEEMFWLKEFDYVITYTYSMMNFAINIGKIKPGFWWLHESKDRYKHRYEKVGDLDISELNKLNIFAVSEVARKNFNECYPNVEVKCLKYGIPDKNKLLKNKNKLLKNKNKLVFAVIGYVNKIKGQDILLDAIEKLSEMEKKEAEFWIIGRIGEDTFGQKIRSVSIMNPNVKILGEFNSDQMIEAFSEIDVVVNPSRQDVFPTVIAEGMMNGKICITTDVTGMAPLIIEGENGFVCKSENVEDLCNKIRWIINNRDICESIKTRARKTYLDNFTMEKFADRLEEIMGIRSYTS